MRDVLQVHEVQQKLECQCICEDSKTRVYLSMVPSERERKRRHREEVRAFTEALKIFFGPMLTLIVQMLVAVGVAMLTCELLSAKLAVVRGYEAVGGELFLAVAVGLAVFQVLNWIFRKWR